MRCRPYTPISTEARGHMDLAVKVYPEGKMGQHLNHLKVGDALDFKGGWAGGRAA
jgi:cytochrome-b5 reductase